MTLPLGLLLFGLYLAYAAHKEPLVGCTLCTFSLAAGLMAAGLVACAVATVGEPRNVVGRLLQEAGKLSYAAYLFHVIFAFIGIKVATKLGYFWIGPILGVAMCAPFAYLIHRWIEQPILNLRHAVEGSAKWRFGCTCLQVLPICAGLLFLFPWSELASHVSALPHLRLVSASLALGVVVLCAYNFRKLKLRLSARPG